jgi:hypothetical protein
VTPLDYGVFFKPFSGGGVHGSATAHLYQDVSAEEGLTYTLTGWAGVLARCGRSGRPAGPAFPPEFVAKGPFPLERIRAW